MGTDRTDKQVHIFFAGRVQGVGFRYTVCRLVERFVLTGFVRNLPDGGVELLAEGAQQVLSDFIADIRNSQLKGYILEERVNWQEPTGNYNQLGVSYV